MTDFLTRLVERTQGQTALVQPQIVTWATPAPTVQTDVEPAPIPANHETTPDEINARRRLLESHLHDSAQSVFEEAQTTTPESSGDQPAGSELPQRHDGFKKATGTIVGTASGVLGSATAPHPFSNQDAVVNQAVGGDRIPIDRAVNVVGATTSQATTRPTEQIVPASSDRPDSRVSLPIMAAGQTVPVVQRAVEHEHEPALDSQLVVDVAPTTTPFESEVTTAARITRPSSAPDATDLEAVSMRSRSPVEPPAIVPLVQTVKPASLVEGDVGEPQAIVAFQHLSSDPMVVPAMESTLPFLPERIVAQPTVKVSIGRVEIRATPPTATAAAHEPPRPRQPALSLADYLQRRNGGSR